MGKTIVVRYETRPGAAEENHRMVRQVFEQLQDDDPGQLRYAAFRLADGVTFVHVLMDEGGGEALSESIAFQNFQKGLGDRLVDPPQPNDATLIGSYRLFQGGPPPAS